MTFEYGGLRGVDYSARWDDLRFPATGISIGGFADPPGVQTDTGLLLFDATTVETVGILAQLPHGWREGTAIKPHCHWAKTTNASGDVVWSMRYKWFGLGDLQGAWSSVMTATDVATIDATQKQNISIFGEIEPPEGAGISSLVMIQFGRLPTDAGDDYAADALLYEFDIHYQIDSFGSAHEFIKQGVSGIQP